MQLSHPGRREVTCLVVGVIAGLAGSSVFRPTSGGGRVPTIAPARGSAPLAIAMAAAPEDERLTLRRRTLTTESASDWKRALAEYQAPESSLAQARSLLYQLDSSALRKLAAAVAIWPHGLRTYRAIRDIFHRWAEVDPLAAMSQLQNLDPVLADDAAYEAMHGFVEGDPIQAAAYFAAPPTASDQSEIRNLGNRRLMVGLALEGWAEQDGQATVNFLNQLPPGTLCQGPAFGLAAEWARQDTAAALNWATHLPDGNAREYALQGVVSTWAETDPQAAGSYALSLTVDSNQGGLIEAFAKQWAAQDLPAAANWVAGQSGEVQAKMAASIVAQWSSSDPAAAVAWSDQLSGAARAAAYNTIAYNWYGLDPAAAQAWLDGLTNGDARDAAIGGYLETWRNDDPPAQKLALAGTINDAGKRDLALVKILNSWLSDAPQAAHLWISQANLPVALTAKLTGG